MQSILTKNIILRILNEQSKTLKTFGVKEIGLFGSYVHNAATEDSDIDLLVDIDKDKKTFKNFLSLNYFLEELFEKKVELLTLQSLSPYIGPHILSTVEYASLGN